MSIQNLKKRKVDAGFTLIEVVLSLVFLGILATAVSTVYHAGFQSMDDQLDRLLLDGQLRSQMELIISTPFDEVTSGTTDVTVEGKTYTLDWTAAFADMDEEGTPETDAKQVVLSVSGLTGYSLEMILVDDRGKVGRI